MNRSSLLKALAIATFALSLSISAAAEDHSHHGDEAHNCQSGGGCDCCKKSGCPGHHDNVCPSGNDDCKHHSAYCTSTEPPLNN